MFPGHPQALQEISTCWGIGTAIGRCRAPGCLYSTAPNTAQQCQPEPGCVHSPTTSSWPWQHLKFTLLITSYSRDQPPHPIPRTVLSHFSTYVSMHHQPHRHTVRPKPGSAADRDTMPPRSASPASFVTEGLSWTGPW